MSSSTAPSTSLHIVSLRQLERELKSAHAGRKLSGEPVTLGRLTDILGVQWDSVHKDIKLIGEVGQGPPILVDQFVPALRTGHHAAVLMTLRSKNPTQPDSVQRVHVSPPELEGTLFLDSLSKADYDAKRRAQEYLATHYREEIKRCSASTTGSEELPHTRIVLLPAKPKLKVEKNGETFTVWIHKLDIILLPAQDLVASSGKDPNPLPPGHPLRDFAVDFTKRFGELERQYPIYKQLHNMYKLFLIAQLLRGLQLPYDFSFWLSEYPLKPYPTDREFPGLKPKTVKHTCWGWPYAETEYSGVTRVRQIWGGVIIAYYQYFPDLFPDHELVLPEDIGASITQLSSISRTTALPPIISLSLPEIRLSLPASAVQAILPDILSGPSFPTFGPSFPTICPSGRYMC